MKIEDYTKISHKRYSSKNNSIIKNEKFIKYLKGLITKVLLSIILIISTCIYIKVDSNNSLLVEKYLFTDNLEFTKINKWYKDKFGELLPTIDSDSNMVFSNTKISTKDYEEYLNGVKITMDKGSPLASIYGGIIVYIGEKDGYDNTIIIQGNDGIDYWYGGLTNVNVSLYDYIEKNTLLGELKNDYLYLVLEKDGQYLNYEEYLK